MVELGESTVEQTDAEERRAVNESVTSTITTINRRGTRTSVFHLDLRDKVEGVYITFSCFYSAVLDLQCSYTYVLSDERRY